MSAVTSVGGIASVAPAAQTGLIADLQWYEQYTSGALNRKAYGIFVPGVYRGFSVAPGDGLNVVVSPESSGPGVACVNVSNYQITVQLITPQTVALTAGKLNIVILEAVYAIGLKTKQVDVDATQDAAKLRVVNAESAIPANAIEIGRITLAAGATSVTAAQIDTTKRLQYQIAYEPTDNINDTRETRLLTVKAGKSFLPLIGGTVTGGLILASTLSVAAAATFSNTMSVIGATTLSDKLNVAGVTTLSNALNVTGAATLSSTLSVTGATNLLGSLTVANSVAITGALGVGGNVTSSGYGSFTASGMALLVRPAAANKLYYLRGQKFDGTAHWYLGQGSDSTDTVTLRNHLTNSYIDLDTNKITLGATTISASGAVAVTGTLSAAGATTLSGTLGVTGATTLSNTLNVTGATTLKGAATLSSTLDVAGAATLSSGLAVTGSIASTGEMLTTSVNSFRIVKGDYGVFHRFDGSGYYILVTASGDQYGNYNSLRPFSINPATGNVAIGTNLGVATFSVTGAATLNSTLSVTGATTLKGDATLSSTLNVAGAVAIGGIATLSNALNVTGAATLASTLAVTGAATFKGALGVTGVVSVGSTATDLTGALLTVNGTASDGSQGIAISSYTPTLSFIDRSVNAISMRLRNDSGFLRIEADNADNGATWNANEAMFTYWGGLSLGGTGTSTGRLLTIGLGTAGKGGLVGTAQYGAGTFVNIGADATVRGVAYVAEMTVGDGATASVLPDFVDYWSNSNTVNANASVTLASSFRSYDKSNTSIATAYAFDGRQASRTGVNRWNLYMQGTAPNYVRGQTIIGGTDTSLPASAYNLEVRGAQHITGNLVVDGIITAGRNDGCIEFTSADGKGQVIRVNYSSAGNFGFWDQTNSAWLLRNDVSNNWYMPAKLEVASDVTIKTNLDVTSQINAGYRINISRSNGNIPYLNFFRTDLTDAPATNQSVQQIFARMGSTTSDPYAGRVLSAVFTNVSISGGGLLYLDARDSVGTTTSRLLLSGDSGSATFTGDVGLSKTLLVSGASTFNGTASFASDVVMSKTLTVGGVGLFTGAVRANQYLDIGYQNNVAGSRQISFYSGSNTTATSTLTVTGATAAASVMDVTATTINLNGTVAVSKTMSIGTDGNALRFNGGTTGFIHRKDANNYYMLATASGDADGSFNALRPLTISLATGLVTLGNSAKVTGALEVTGQATLSSTKVVGTHEITQAATIGGTLSVSGDAVMAGSLAVSGSITTSSELISTKANAIRVVQGSYGVIHRSDGANYYIMLTASGDQYGLYNSLRPFSINTATGNVNIGTNLTVTGNISAGGGTSILSPDGNVYGSVWGGWLSTWLFNNRVSDVRLGAALTAGGTIWSSNVTWTAPAGYVMTGMSTRGQWDMDGKDDYIYHRPIQKCISGVWYTVGQVD